MTLTRMKRTIGVLITAGALALAVTPAASASTPPATPDYIGPVHPKPDANGFVAGLPDPGAKRNAPATDLANHPKGSLQSAKAPVTPPVASSGGDVSVIDRNSAGQVTGITEYTPAAGVTAEELAAVLRRAGANATVDRPAAAQSSSSSITPAAVNPFECSYGAARAFGDGLPGYCPNPTHWNNEGFANPHVRFNDHTSAAWPVNTAVYDWNTANGINSYYAYNSCPFQVGARCVDVFSGNYGDTRWAGKNFIGIDANTHAYQDSTAVIDLNDYYPFSSNPPRKTAEHELGHGVGLGHEINTGSVMTSTAAYSTINTGSPNDFTSLANLYSIVW